MRMLLGELRPSDDTQTSSIVASSSKLDVSFTRGKSMTGSLSDVCVMNFGFCTRRLDSRMKQ